MTDEEIIHRSSIFAVNGIWTNPETIRQNWTDRFELWGEQHGDLHVDPFRFRCFWFSRYWRMPSRLRNLRWLIRKCPRPFKYVVAHSFGCEVALRAIDEGDVAIRNVVLIQAATEANCRDNLINVLLREGKVERFTVTYSASDRALKASMWWPPRLRRPLGLFGPENVEKSDLVSTLDLRHMNHTEMWQEENFDSTYRWIVKETLGISV